MWYWFLCAVLVITPLLLTPAASSGEAAGAPGTQVPRPVIVLDPGHMPETAGAISADGTLVEHILTLELAQLIVPMLEQRGFVVHLTRRPDGSLVLPVRDENENGKIDDFEHLQPRTDLANLMGADVVVSLHFNGSAYPEHKGTAVYYASVGPYRTQSARLAVLMQAALVRNIRSHGYATVDWGALSDAGLKSYGTLYSLGQNPQFVRLGRWPAVLIEPLFLTNDADAAFLKQPGTLAIIARAVVEALDEYFGGRTKAVRDLRLRRWVAD